MGAEDGRPPNGRLYNINIVIKCHCWVFSILKMNPPCPVCEPCNLDVISKTHFWIDGSKRNNCLPSFLGKCEEECVLIENFSSFGKSQVTEIPTTQTPFLEAVNTKTNNSTTMIKQ
jgi:hypothetical protein